MKKIKRIKWENVFTLIAIIFALVKIIPIINNVIIINKNYISISMLGMATISVYLLGIIGIRYLIKKYRQNPTQLFLDK